MTDQTPADAPLEADLSLIQRIIPHRYPFLLVDKAVSYTHLDLYKRQAQGICPAGVALCLRSVSAFGNNGFGAVPDGCAGGNLYL